MLRWLLQVYLISFLLGPSRAVVTLSCPPTSTPGVDPTLWAACQNLASSISAQLATGTAASAGATLNYPSTNEASASGTSAAQVSQSPVVVSTSTSSNALVPAANPTSTSAGGVFGSSSATSASSSFPITSSPSSSQATSNAASSVSQPATSNGVSSNSQASSTGGSAAASSSAAALSQSSTNQDDSHHYRNTVVIPAAVVCSVVGVALIALLAFCLIRRKRRQSTGRGSPATEEKGFINNGSPHSSTMLPPAYDSDQTFGPIIPTAAAGGTAAGGTGGTGGTGGIGGGGGGGGGGREPAMAATAAAAAIGGGAVAGRAFASSHSNSPRVRSGVQTPVINDAASSHRSTHSIVAESPPMIPPVASLPPTDWNSAMSTATGSRTHLPQSRDINEAPSAPFVFPPPSSTPPLIQPEPVIPRRPSAPDSSAAQNDTDLFANADSLPPAMGVPPPPPPRSPQRPTHSRNASSIISNEASPNPQHYSTSTGQTGTTIATSYLLPASNRSSTIDPSGWSSSSPNHRRTTSGGSDAPIIPVRRRGIDSPSSNLSNSSSPRASFMYHSPPGSPPGTSNGGRRTPNYEFPFPASPPDPSDHPAYRRPPTSNEPQYVAGAYPTSPTDGIIYTEHGVWVPRPKIPGRPVSGPLPGREASAFDFGFGNPPLPDESAANIASAGNATTAATGDVGATISRSEEAGDRRWSISRKPVGSGLTDRRGSSNVLES